MSSDTFSTTISDAQAGRPDAFASLYRSLQPALLRYLWIGSGDRAEDIAAECWVEVVKRLGRFEGDEAGFRAWVFTIARSKAVDSGRKLARNQTTPLDPDVHDVSTSPEQTAERVEEIMSTRRALELISTLPPDQAEAVTLRVVASLDVPEVAAIMGRTTGSVRVLTHRGLKKLAATLQAANRTDDRGDAA